jgi:hypothetical protein
VAAQRIKHLEDERNYFEMAQEQALEKLKTRIQEQVFYMEVS